MRKRKPTGTELAEILYAVFRWSLQKFVARRKKLLPRVGKARRQRERQQRASRTRHEKHRHRELNPMQKLK